MTLLLSVIPMAAQSQFASTGSELRREVSSERWFSSQSNLWCSTTNPSALSFYDYPKTSGSAELSANYMTGGLRRAMDPKEDYSFNFASESYNYLQYVDLYGSFRFTQQNLKGKIYSENYDPYNGNPYIAGSTLYGDYTKQLFAFKFALSSKTLWKMVRFGIKLDYQVGDLSRFNDPRSRVQLADYTITPGFVLNLTPSDRLGLSASYRFRKEKMLKPVSKSEGIDRYIYCTQKGVSEYAESALLFFSRRYIGNYGGGELQYEHNSSRLSLMLHAGANYRFDDVIGERKENPGNYTSLEYYGGFNALWGSESLKQKFTAKFSYNSGHAQECLQEQKTEINEQGIPDSFWQTIMKNVRYRNSDMSANLLWSITKFSSGQYVWDAGVSLDASWYVSKYIIPTSTFNTAFIEPALTGGAVLFRKSSNEINLSARLGWHQNLLSSLSLNPDLDKEHKTRICNNVTLPDYQTLSRSSLAFGLNFNYIFVSIKKIRLYCTVSTNQYYALTPPAPLSSVSSLPLSSLSLNSSSSTPFRIWSELSFGILY